MSDPMIYKGFDVNGEECERALGEAFETHLPPNQIVYRVDGREVVANVGDTLPVWLCGAPETWCALHGLHHCDEHEDGR